jgi:SagB-type dehydrogenase family enzyme
MRKNLIVIVAFTLVFASGIFAQQAQNISLLPPQLDKGKSLMNALAERHSTREFSSKELSLQDLSNLLWAANGINRPDIKKRTAPTAMNWQEIDIYVFLETGVYFYDAVEMKLQAVVSGDNRAIAGTQEFVKTAPVNLIYVADYTRMGKAKEESKPSYASADAAFIGENVYLFCAAFDMACVLRASVDKQAVAKLLNLRTEQHVVFGQSVGFAK